VGLSLHCLLVVGARRERNCWKHYKHPLRENVYDVYM
jgi:hypothetical protein